MADSYAHPMRTVVTNDGRLRSASLLIFALGAKLSLHSFGSTRRKGGRRATKGADHWLAGASEQIAKWPAKEECPFGRTPRSVSSLALGVKVSRRQVRKAAK